MQQTTIWSGNSEVGELWMERDGGSITLTQDGEFEHNETTLSMEAMADIRDAAQKTLRDHRTEPNETVHHDGTIGSVSYDGTVYSVEFLRPDIAFWTDGPEPGEALTKQNTGEMFFVEGEDALEAFVDAVDSLYL